MSDCDNNKVWTHDNFCKENQPNSLTPDDRLFLAYLAAWISENHGTRSMLEMAEYICATAKYICENYKEQEK